MSNLGKSLAPNMNRYTWSHPVVFSSADWWKAPAARHPRITTALSVSQYHGDEKKINKKLSILALTFMRCLWRGWLSQSPNWLCFEYGWNITQQPWWEKGPAGPWPRGYCVFIIIHTGLGGQHCLGRQQVSLKANPQQQQESTVWTAHPRILLLHTSRLQRTGDEEPLIIKLERNQYLPLGIVNVL